MAGRPGIGHPRFATRSTGEDMLVVVSGRAGRDVGATRVVVLDAGKVIATNRGVWPVDPRQLALAVQRCAACVLLDADVDPPSMVRLDGVEPGTRVVVVTGAEALFGYPPRPPPPTQAVVANVSQFPQSVQVAIPADAVRAGSDDARPWSRALAGQMGRTAAPTAPRRR